MRAYDWRLDENRIEKCALEVKVEDGDMDECIDRQPKREVWSLSLIVGDEGSEQRADDERSYNNELQVGIKTCEKKTPRQNTGT